MSEPLTVTEQRALAQAMKDPAWAERTWDEAAVEEWRRSAAYVEHVAAVETHRDRLRREAEAFERRQIAEREAFDREQRRRMDGANS
jgi:hypothetical protein